MNGTRCDIITTRSIFLPLIDCCGPVVLSKMNGTHLFATLWQMQGPNTTPEYGTEVQSVIQ